MVLHELERLQCAVEEEKWIQCRLHHTSVARTSNVVNCNRVASVQFELYADVFRLQSPIQNKAGITTMASTSETALPSLRMMP
jgi:hypothetical protein